MFDFDEIEQVDPELLPGDWVKVRSLGEQGIVLSLCNEGGRYKVCLTSYREDYLERCDLQQLGDRERLASLMACLLAASLDSPQFVAEARRIQRECSNPARFAQRMGGLTVKLGAVYAVHQVTEEWLNRQAEIFVPQDEELAGLWRRLGGIGEILAYRPTADLGAPSPSAPSGAAEPHVKTRWVVVAPRGDVCNRLCALVAARSLAADLGRELLVDWRPCAECACNLEGLLEATWFQLLSAELIRQESALHWAWRVISIWHEVLARASRGEEVVLTEFNECHKKAFRKRLAYHVDTASTKWRELRRLQGFTFENLPDFLQVECICISRGGWFYPPRPCDEAEAATERSYWLNGLRPAPHLAQRVFQLPPGAVCVHAARGGGAAGRSPERLLLPELDTRLAKMQRQADGGGCFCLATDDPALEEALRQRYGERLLALPRLASELGTSEAAEDALVQLLLLGQGEEIIGSYGSAMSGLAPLFRATEVLVLDAESEGGRFHAGDGWAVDAEERARAREEVDVVARDPSETMGFHLRGSWDGWTGFTKFQTPTHGESEYVASAKVRQPPQVEEFYIVKDCDPRQRYYPQLGGGLVMGPDGTEGAAWRLRVPRGCERLEVRWRPAGGRHLAWRLLAEGGGELAEVEEPGLKGEELEGPFFLVGSWDGWTNFEEMWPVTGNGHQQLFFALARLRQPVQAEEFQVTLGRGWERRFYLARGSSAVLGPTDSCNGHNWRVLPAAHCKWLGVYWDPRKGRSLRCECYESMGGPASPLTPLGQFYLVGSWDNWAGFLHLRPEATSNPHCRVRIKVKQAPVAVQFQVVLDRDWRQRFWRGRASTEVLGPGDAEGANWAANVPAGHRWIEVIWDPTGSRSLRWSLVGDLDAMKTTELFHNPDSNIRIAEYTRLTEERAAMVEKLPVDVCLGLCDVELCIPQVYRYHSDGLDDAGWGCVYRNLQTLLETLGHDVPPLVEITCAMGTGNEWLRQPGTECAWAEPHDVAEYLRRHAGGSCRATRLLWVAGREPLEVQEGDSQAKMVCKVGTEATYEVLNRPPDVLHESREAKRHALRVREALVQQLLRARTPVLLDDKEAAFLVVGFRGNTERGPEYRILDPHYGQTYAHRGNRRFNPAWGPDQFGPDGEKDQWVSARWVEEGLGLHNGYNPNPSWMMLFVN